MMTMSFSLDLILFTKFSENWFNILIPMLDMTDDIVNRMVLLTIPQRGYDLVEDRESLEENRYFLLRLFRFQL
jgi:hypothetical protein